MRRLLATVLFVAIAACGTTSRRTDDAAVQDARQVEDAWPDAPGLDAYVRLPCDAPPTFADGRMPSRVLHVSPGAAGGDGSSAAPFGSIAAAAAVATPGTFIQLAPGVHATNQFVPNLRGTAEAPIWIGGVFGTRPVITGGTEALHFTRPAYVVVQHLAIQSQSSNGINIDDGVNHAGDTHHVALIDVNVSNLASMATATCVRAAGVDDFYIYDSVFENCGGGIDQIGVHRSVIARTMFDDMEVFAVRARGGSTDVDVRQSYIRNAGAAVTMGGSTPLSWFRPPVSTTTPNADARRVRAFNNVVFGSTTVPFAFQGCVDCLVAHNLTYGNPLQLIQILPGTTSQDGYAFDLTKDGRVINNSFVWSANQLFSHVEVAPSTQATTFTFSHNLWYAQDVPTQSTPTLPVAETGSVIGMNTGYLPWAPVYCGGPEASTATPLPEIDGTIGGRCRAEGDAPTIGPHRVRINDCAL